MAIPAGKELLIFIERDATDGNSLYARMSEHIRDAIEQQFPGSQVVSPPCFMCA